MADSFELINDYLVEVFNEILIIEETALQNSSFQDVSIKEMHTVEAIGMYRKRTTSEVARKLSITVGTLTVAVNNLVKKGYVERIRSENDRRVVKLGLTKRGRLLYRLHDKFHKEMVKETVEGMNQEEIEILIKGLGNLHGFLDKTKNKLKEQG
ncbi:MarR family winged helix-turn-helix transcriptional regulator [Carnobacterium divergens]|uniref:MarR family transcriptional regulator n=1 Tax=Carnobacterium divergens TaxID=2748 RepID=A0A7Z8CYK3_CARDV|nr:MarR family transcriptional regulator [Carnobacterium divergens]TFI72350.1 MarR family transcriptional regulator [Carnobacterium divergens]TFI76897.1 MarR family transcriptional regulator [Carnobacterium divergens]TFI83080.1 MarR family transcriptional regulator [Carnobacterium divergens]TFI95069.1 MarR family transcriptional regulator [Carnobacterium divergens]TFJ11601.1 MarR family transcriptional regulator [Carnobacterium divergens]